MLGLKIHLALIAAPLAALWLTGRVSRRSGRALGEPLLTLSAAGALAILVFFAWVAWRQLRFPVQLECMEWTVLRHAERLAAGLPVYPRPSSEFVALAYNPGLYVLLAPLLKVLPPSLTLLRVPAVLATAGLTVLFFFAAARRAQGGRRWGLIAAALPALAYRSFDCYLTKGHSDSLMILAAIGGALLLPRRGDAAPTGRAVAAAVCFALGFWFKQHGALPAFGAGLYLLARDRWRAWPALLALGLLGPVAWLIGGPAWFGPDFLESTLRVPASWSRWDLAAPLRVAGYFASWWAVPLAVAAGAWVAAVRRRRLLEDPVLFVYPFALLSSLLGALDHGSSDNVFAMGGAWTLLVAVRTLAPALTPRPGSLRQRAAIVALALTAALLVNDAREWVPAGNARAAYGDLRSMLAGLDGPLYAPWWGDGPDGVHASSRLHWVALEDRVRGPGAPPPRSPFVVSMLAPVASASAPAYVLTVGRLEADPLLGWLAGDYALDKEFGSRFEAIHELPTRFGGRAPHYLYKRVTPSPATGGQ